MKSEKEKMPSGERYDASDPELAVERERTGRLTRRYNRTAPTDREERRELLESPSGRSATTAR